MVLAYHITLGMYGFWLPNDPRGSWSDYVRSAELYRHGAATKTDTRRSVAYRPHNQHARLRAKNALRFPPVVLNGIQARAVGRGFADYTACSELRVHACAILPTHTHLVIARHRLPVEKLAIALKGAATRRLVREDVHPLAAYSTSTVRTPEAFARGHWRVFLDEPTDVRRAIDYVRRNPIKEGKPIQNWSFVVPYEPYPDG